MVTQGWKGVLTLSGVDVSSVLTLRGVDLTLRVVDLTLMVVHPSQGVDLTLMGVGVCSHTQMSHQFSHSWGSILTKGR
jgi:hypothetical protein